MFSKTFSFVKRVVMGFLGNDCPMYAAGLTYFALLAAVPILCCILVAAKTCHVERYAKVQINERINAMIENIEKGQDDSLAQLTPQDEEARRKKKIAAEEFAAQAHMMSDELFKRIDGFDIETLGWIGFGLLLWTVISTLGTVETSFNRIWGVPKPRPIWKRAYMYLIIMIALPVMATVVMSLPILNVVKNVIVATLGATWLTQWVSDGLIWFIDCWVFRAAIVLLTSSLTLGFFFWIMPNGKVKFMCAWLGGLITAVLLGAWVKICSVAQVGIAKSSALYGSFALLPIILAWLYMTWQIVLLGANIVKALEEKPA
ncbi:MAG: YihY/virulence factor BrkB family protein [Kiritimatiellae bacterium]|nr:YihY/virulence factor BrkB family protein [Kiritimatiellia bacterium]